MIKLVVNNDRNAPAKKVAALLAVWGTLAELVDKAATLTKYCALSWKVVIQPEGFQQYGEAESRRLEACCSVQMFFYALIDEIEGQTQFAEVPITTVEHIVIREDGTFSWYSTFKTLEEDPKRIALIAKGVSQGKLHRKYKHFACHDCNMIPRYRKL